jgi:hypothetical protein
MATWEIPSLPDHGPYSATVGTDGYTYVVRIEPPFIPGNDILADRDVDFELVACGANSTLLVAFSDEPEQYGGEYMRAVQVSADGVLKQLGQLGSKQIFTEYWQQYNGQGK